MTAIDAQVRSNPTAAGTSRPLPSHSEISPDGSGSPLRHDTQRSAIFAKCPTGFWLFLLVNVALFIRPAEITETLANWPIYECLILLCLACSLPAVVPQLRWGTLKKNPVTICVLGLWLAIILSCLRHGDTWTARQGAREFGKVVIYYLLLVGLVSTPRRLRSFLLTITVLVTIMAAITVANYHYLIQVPALRVLLQQQFDQNTETIDFIPRLQAMGIFSDPNDFSLILVTAMLVTVHLILPSRAGAQTRSRGDTETMSDPSPRPRVPASPCLGPRIALMAMLGLLAYAFGLTRSRGGFLSLIAAVGVYALARWGWKRSLPILALGAPLLFFAFGGRQTDITLNANDTGMGRIMIWRDALVVWHSSPVFGIGFDRLADEIDRVGHNSFVHSLAELGVFGETMFVGTVFFLVYGLWRTRISAFRPPPSTLNARDSSFIIHHSPLLLALVCGYAAGMMSLSRQYTVSTYVVLGIGAAFLALAASFGGNLAPRKPVIKLLVASFATVVFFEVLVRVADRL